MDVVINPNLIKNLSKSLGTSEPALRLLLSVLAGYPIAGFYRTFLYGKAANLQHLFFFLAGFGLGYLNYGVDVLHSLFAMIFTYVTLTCCGPTRKSVIIVFLFNLIYLLMGYYYVGTDNYDINWTMPQCVLVLRLIGLAFDFYDGSFPIDSLSPENKKVALTSSPSFLEICGHTFFPSSYLVGPQFPMKRYQEFVMGMYSENDVTVPPNSLFASLRRFLLGIFYLSLFQLLGFFISDSYILSNDFNNLIFPMKCFWLGMWGKFTLYKYISCWLLTEGACIMFGLTYNGKDENGTALWNGLENVKIGVLENATEFNDYILSFNINTNHWVAQYIYKRLKFLGNRHISQAVALLFLAVWHGFHSGYYICFAFEFAVMYLEKHLKPIIQGNATVSALFQKPLVNLLIHNVLLRIYTFVFMGWCLLPFALLTYDRYWPVYRSVCYIGFIVFGLYPVIYGPLLKLILKAKASHTD